MTASERSGRFGICACVKPSVCRGGGGLCHISALIVTVSESRGGCGICVINETTVCGRRVGNVLVLDTAIIPVNCC